MSFANYLLLLGMPYRINCNFRHPEKPRSILAVLCRYPAESQNSYIMNRSITKFLATCALLTGLALPTVQAAEDFYIAQTGTTTASNSASAPSAVTFFNTASNWSSPTKVTGKIGPGDKVHLVGVLSTALTVQASGTSTAPITVFFESGAKLSTPYWGVDAAGAIAVSGKNYITIDGNNTGIIECTANGDGLANQRQSTGIYATNCNTLEIKNLTIQNIYTHVYNTNNVVSAYTTQCIKVSGSSNLSIHDNSLNNAYVAFYVFTESAVALSTINVYNNTITACSTDIIAALGSSGSSMDAINIYNNNITMGSNWFDTPDNNHVDGIHCWTSANGNITNMTIRENYIHGDPSTHCTGYIFLEGAIISPAIRNNLLVGLTNHPAEAFIDLSATGGTCTVYNNTIVGLGTSSAGGIGIVFYTSGVTASIINNIMSSLYVAVSNNSGSSVTWNSNYNNYYNVGNIGYVSGFKASLSSWAAVTGGDANSITTDPALNATAFTLPLASPAASVGQNFYTLFQTDKAGNARAAPNAKWDLGAYVAGGAATPTPPSNAKTTISIQ
jgi:hypothetical protein